MKKYLFLVVALLFASFTVTTAQRKVVTDKLQVTRLKNSETIGTDSKGNLISKKFPKVDLTKLKDELAKKLAKGSYEGTAADLAEALKELADKVKEGNSNAEELQPLIAKINANKEAINNLGISNVQGLQNKLTRIENLFLNIEETDPKFTAWDKDYNDLINKPMGLAGLVQVTKNNKTGYVLSYSNDNSIAKVGDSSVDLGYYNSYSTNGIAGNYSFNVGFDNDVFGDNCYVIGMGNSSGYAGNFVVGTSNKPKGSSMNIIGHCNTPKGQYSTTIGYGLKTNAYREVVVGSYNAPVISVNYNYEWKDLGDRLFTIGNGKDDYNRSNAIVVYRSGNMDLNGVLKLKPMPQPKAPKKGTIYFDSSDNKLKCYNGSEWKSLF